MLTTNEIQPNAPWREGKGIAEIPLTLSITQSATPKEGAGTFTTSINLSAGSSTNLANGSTVYWKVTDISNDDLASGDLTGYGTITDGKLDVQHSLVFDSDSGESFEMSAYSDSGRSQQIGATYSIEIQELESIEAVQAQTIEVEQAQNIDTVHIETTNINRLYNSSSNRYLFSSNQTEIDILTGQPEWVNEGVAYSSPEVGTAQVYRFHLTQENRHFYTANNEERNHIISSPAFSPWSYEGIAFNVFSQEVKPQSTIPVVRYFNANYNSHL